MIHVIYKVTKFNAQVTNCSGNSVQIRLSAINTFSLAKDKQLLAMKIDRIVHGLVLV